MPGSGALRRRSEVAGVVVALIHRISFVRTRRVKDLSHAGRKAAISATSRGNLACNNPKVMNFILTRPSPDIVR